MDLFHVETGAIPAHGCHEESVPMLQGHSSKGGTSKAFLVHDSMACIANITLALGDVSTTAPGLDKDPGIKNKTSNTKNILPNVMDSEPSKLTTSRSPEYRSLSPFNLQDPVVPPAQSSTKERIAAKSSERETDCLLRSGELDQKQPLRDGIVASSDNHDQVATAIPSAVSIECSPALNTSTSSPSVKSTMVPETSRSPENQNKGKKKTLEELAKEWQAGQADQDSGAGQADQDSEAGEAGKADQATEASPASQESGHKEAVSSKQLIESGEDDESQILVRHSTYYSSPFSSVSGMTSEEYKLRKKLKARLHLRDDDVTQARSYGGQPLVKLAKD